MTWSDLKAVQQPGVPDSKGPPSHFLSAGPFLSFSVNHTLPVSQKVLSTGPQEWLPNLLHALPPSSPRAR